MLQCQELVEDTQFDAVCQTLEVHGKLINSEIDFHLPRAQWRPQLVSAHLQQLTCIAGTSCIIVQSLLTCKQFPSSYKTAWSNWMILHVSTKNYWLNFCCAARWMASCCYKKKYRTCLIRLVDSRQCHYVRLHGIKIHQNKRELWLKQAAIFRLSGLHCWPLLGSLYHTHSASLCLRLFFCCLGLGLDRNNALKE